MGIGVVSLTPQFITRNIQFLVGAKPFSINLSKPATHIFSRSCKRSPVHVCFLLDCIRILTDMLYYFVTKLGGFLVYAEHFTKQREAHLVDANVPNCIGTVLDSLFNRSVYRGILVRTHIQTVLHREIQVSVSTVLNRLVTVFHAFTTHGHLLIKFLPESLNWVSSLGCPDCNGRKIDCSEPQIALSCSY